MVVISKVHEASKYLPSANLLVASLFLSLLRQEKCCFYFTCEKTQERIRIISIHFSAVIR